MGAGGRHFFPVIRQTVATGRPKKALDLLHGLVVRHGRHHFPTPVPILPGILQQFVGQRKIRCPGRFGGPGQFIRQGKLNPVHGIVQQDSGNQQRQQQHHPKPKPLHFVSSFRTNTTLSSSSTVNSQVLSRVAWLSCNIWDTQARSFPASELPAYEQVHPLEALDYIMQDLDSAENKVMLTYSDPKSNRGRITRNAVLAMKADVNLWRAAFTDWCSKCGEEKYNKHPLVNANVQSYYSECIDNCQAVLNNIDKVYENNNSKPGHGKNEDELPYHLISNHDENAIKNETFQSRVYDEIFGQENSAESIFELQIDQKLCESYSLGLTSMYGHKDAAGQLEVPRSFMNKYERDDLRKYSYTNFPYVTGAQEPAKLAVAKYISKESPTPETMRAQKDIDANWIVYRQTDVMLMMAEALVLQPSVNSNDIKKSFEIVNLINTRSRVDTTNIRNPLKLPADAASAVELVLDERVRELAFEGKRWYDLVRKALRENTTDNIKFVADKLTSNVTSLKNKMLKIDNLFLPIYIDELRFNKNLVQNPAYDSVDSSIGMNK